VLPTLEVLDGICGAKCLTLASVVVLVDDIGEVIVRSRGDHVCTVLDARSVVAVDVFDGAQIAIRQRVRTSAEYRIGAVQLLKVCRPCAGVGENHEGNIGNSSKRMEVGVSTKTIHIPKVNNNWVYDEVKESAGA
jgi:DNA-binding protein